MAADALLRFSLGGQDMALRLSDVLEVAPCPPLRAVPGAPSCLRGVTDLRGRLVTVLDTATLAYIPTGDAPWLARLVDPRSNLALSLGGELTVERSSQEWMRPAHDPSGLTRWEVVTAKRILQVLEPDAVVARLDEELVARLVSAA